MPYLLELLLMGMDVGYIYCKVQEYMLFRRKLKEIQEAPKLQIDDGLRSYIESQPEQKVPFAFINGMVTTHGVPLRSTFTPPLLCALQVIQRRIKPEDTTTLLRFRHKFFKNIQRTVHSIPFELSNNNQSVVISNAENALRFNLETNFVEYDSREASCFEYLKRIFTKLQQSGIQSKEEIVRIGGNVTAAGELCIEDGQITLRAPEHHSFILTSGSKTALVDNINNAQLIRIMKIIAVGGFFFVCVASIMRKIAIQRKHRLWKAAREKERLARRRRHRASNIRNRCVICYVNPKEVVVLPCAHICICEDCSPHITDTCPICRGPIVKKHSAII